MNDTNENNVRKRNAGFLKIYRRNQSCIFQAHIQAFQSVHHITFILCYTVLYNFFALVFSLISVRKHW